MSVVVPAVLERTVRRTWGGAGAAWLAGLPDRVGALAARWGLEIGAPLPMSFHWVSAVDGAGGPAVLKIGVPDGHLDAEAAALGAYDGNGSVRLLRSDPARGALLLERAVPGRTAESLVPDEDGRATDVLVDLLRQLHTAPVPAEGLPHVRAEGAAFAEHLARFSGDDPLPRRTVEHAASLFEELCDSAPADVVLHGDLHHANALTATRRPWLAIDPHGHVGDPGYDTGQLLYNPMDGDADLVALAPERVERVADGLRADPDRVRAWGFVVCVLSEVWSAGDGPIDGVPLAVARRLEVDL